MLGLCGSVCVCSGFEGFGVFRFWGLGFGFVGFGLFGFVKHSL